MNKIKHISIFLLWSAIGSVSTLAFLWLAYAVVLLLSPWF